MREKQQAQVARGGLERPLVGQWTSGTSVLARQYSGNNKWQAGTITHQLGPRNLLVQCGERIEKRHIDQLRPAFASGGNSAGSRNAETAGIESLAVPHSSAVPHSPVVPYSQVRDHKLNNSNLSTPIGIVGSACPSGLGKQDHRSPGIRRSERISKPVIKLNL